MMGKTVRFMMNVGPTSTPLEGSLNSLYCATTSQALKDQGNFLLPVGKPETKAEKWLNDLEGNAKLWRLGEGQMARAT